MYNDDDDYNEEDWASELETEDQVMMYLLTRLLHKVNPSIDKAQTYAILTQWLDEGMTNENVDDFGAMIKATSLKVASKVSH